MGDHDVTAELHRAETARRLLTDDLRRLRESGRAVVAEGSRALQYVRPFLMGAAALTVVVGGSFLLLGRRRAKRLRWVEPQERPSFLVRVAQTVLLNAAGAIAASLAKQPSALLSSLGRTSSVLPATSERTPTVPRPAGGPRRGVAS